MHSNVDHQINSNLEVTDSKIVSLGDNLEQTVEQSAQSVRLITQLAAKARRESDSKMLDKPLKANKERASKIKTPFLFGITSTSNNLLSVDFNKKKSVDDWENSKSVINCNYVHNPKMCNSIDVTAKTGSTKELAKRTEIYSKKFEDGGNKNVIIKNPTVIEEFGKIGHKILGDLNPNYESKSQFTNPSISLVLSNTNNNKISLHEKIAKPESVKIKNDSFPKSSVYSNEFIGVKKNFKQINQNVNNEFNSMSSEEINEMCEDVKKWWRSQVNYTNSSRSKPRARTSTYKLSVSSIGSVGTNSIMHNLGHTSSLIDNPLFKQTSTAKSYTNSLRSVSSLATKRRSGVAGVISRRPQKFKQNIHPATINELIQDEKYTLKEEITNYDLNY